MIPFTSNAIAVTYDNNLYPNEDIIFDKLLDEFEIPINVITDENHPIFQSAIQKINPKLQIAFIIIIIKYLEHYEA